MWFLINPIIGIITTLLAICVILQKRNLSYWTRINVPQLENKFPWGHVPNLLKGKQPLCLYSQDYYKIMKGRGYKFAGFNVAIIRSILLIDPEIIKEIMIKNFDHFVNRCWYYNEKDDPLGANLLSLEGQEWYKIRTRVSPTFTASKMKLMFELVDDCGKLLEQKIMKLHDSKTVLDIKLLTSCFTIDIIGRCAFGVECNSIQNSESDFTRYTKKMMTPSMKRGVIHFIGLAWPNLARKLGLMTIPKDVSDFFLGSVKSTIDYRKGNNVKRNDFLQLLLEMTYDKADDVEKPLTYEQVAANSFFFFIAGYETSSSTLNFCLYELAKNQDIQEKARTEINKVLSKNEGNLSYDILKEMKYLQQVIDESLRQYPPIPTTSRRCTKSFVIPGTDILLEPETKLLINIYALHHDPDYFPEPDKFDPERFSDENKSNIKPFTYLPFGTGPRNCVGYKFSYLEVKIGLIYFLKKFKFTLNPKTPQTLSMLPSSILLSNKEPVYLDTEKIEE